MEHNRPVFDYSKLLGKIRERGYTQDRLCKKIGLGLTSFNLSLNNKRGFRQEEIVAICEALDISAEDASSYFFKQ